MSSSTGNPVVDAILAGTNNLEVRDAMLIGSYLESGWNENAVGDQGTSFGPFQMHIGGALTEAGGTAQDAENPTWAVQHMLGAYEAGVNSVPASTWQTDPETAAEEAAVAAERPAQTYFTADGTQVVNQAWQATQNALKGVVSAPGSPGQTPQQAALLKDPFPGGSLNPLNWPSEIGSDIGGTTGDIASGLGSGLAAAFDGIFGTILKQLGIPSLKDLLIRFGLIVLGFVILIVGLTQLTHVSVTPPASSGPGETGNAEPEPANTATSPPSKQAASKSRTPGSRPSGGTTVRAETGSGSALGKVAKSSAELAAL